MIKKVNPKIGMFEALQLSADHCKEGSIVTVRVFLDRNFSAPIDVIYPQINQVKSVAIAFRYRQASYIIPAGHWLVKDRKSGDLTIYPDADFQNLYYEFTPNAEKELKKLADYILKVAPEQISEGSPVDIAIRIIGVFKNVVNKIVPNE